MRFFAKLTFICNVCFIVSFALRLVEIKGNFDGLVYQPIEGTIAIIGLLAVILNFFFVLFSIYWLLSKKIKSIPRWIVFFNVIIFPVQVFFFFLSG